MVGLETLASWLKMESILLADQEQSPAENQRVKLGFNISCFPINFA
jgi:hypothetical protein